MKQEGVVCAWCPSENEEEPQEGQSHGICDEHSEALLLRYHWQRLERVPSYVERFADKEAEKQ